MDSFEWNKIAGAVLFALLVAFGLGVFSDLIFETGEPETPGYVVAVATEEGDAGGAPAGPQPIAVLLASADADAGANVVKKCVACHTFDEGGANKVGPNLWGVVNRPIASHEGYEYDEAMHAYAQEAGNWTYDHLSAFLHDPKGTVPGTKMAFAGLRNDSERANAIAYLRTLSADPAPLPEVTEAPAAEAETQVASAEPAEPPLPAAGTASPDPQVNVPEEPIGDADPAAAEVPPPGGEQPPAAEAPAAESSMAAADSAAPAEPAPAAEAPAPAPEATAPEAAAPAAESPTPAEPAPAEPAQQTAQAEPAAPAAAAADPGAGGDVAKGEAFAKRCTVCHSLEPGGPNKVGPHIFGVVGRPVASIADYNYSDAMKAFAEGGKVWTPENLDTYLADPRKVVPGTKMVFPGVKDADRANVIAYLETLKE